MNCFALLFQVPARCLVHRSVIKLMELVDKLRLGQEFCSLLLKAIFCFWI